MLKFSVILLVSSPLLHLLLLFATQSYSGTYIRGETSIPTRNVLLLCISRSYFFPSFLLLPESFYCVPGAINCNKDDLKIMSNFTQDDDHQSSNVLLSVWECDKFDRKGAKGNKEFWCCGLCRNEYNIGNSTKALMHLTRFGSHSIARCRGDILPKYQCQPKSLKEKK